MFWTASFSALPTSTRFRCDLSLVSRLPNASQINRSPNTKEANDEMTAAELQPKNATVLGGLEAVFSLKRQDVQPPNDKPASQGILLDNFTDRSAPCDKCGIIVLPKLCRPTSKICVLLLGNLSDNFIEMGPLEEAKPERDIPELISDLWRISKTGMRRRWVQRVSLDGWGGAERLLGCFISQVPVLLEAEQPPDRYGYKCRIQTEVTLNAMTKSNYDSSYDCLSRNSQIFVKAPNLCENEPRSALYVGPFPTITSTISSLSNILDRIYYTRINSTQFKNHG
ncbi:hypothetical protein B0H14DRAFT_2623985 [Mycena olivaceomarginata]|nr:hypothetical protein B0H14DRAFT_2623985 [Mycena olivaceomarginata]